MSIFEGINLIVGFLAVVIGIVMFWSLPVPLPQKHAHRKLPFISIIIPARNEAERISSLLQSLQKQNFQSFEILVVDDDSTDNTAAIATEYGAKVVQSKGENSGAGKSMACWLGAKQAKGEWLLFLDADTQFTNEDSMENLLNLYQQKGASGILSLQPYHTVENGYEQLSAIFNIIVVVGMNLFTIWGRKFKTAGSFGPCMLTSREDYFLTGGHKEIQDAIMDDLEMGQAFLKHNLPVYCLGGKGTISFRMYPEGFKTLVEGWCKSFAIGSKSTHPIVMVLVIIWISGSFISVGELISSINSGSIVAIIFSSILYLFYAIQTAIFARRCGNFKWIIFLFYPLLFLFFAGVFLYSLFCVHILGTVTWKGRKIEV